MLITVCKDEYFLKKSTLKLIPPFVLIGQIELVI